MKNTFLFLAIMCTGCASQYNYPQPEKKDLCLESNLEIYPKYFMNAGRHTLKETQDKKNIYSTENITGTVSSVNSISVTRYSDTVSYVCMVEFTHELCADVHNLKYCD